MDTADEIMQLVRTVAELPDGEQDRLLRLAGLLTLAPAAARRRGNGQLRALIASQPQSKRECLGGIDELIADLERSVAAAEERASSRADSLTSLPRGTTQ